MRAVWRVGVAACAALLGGAPVAGAQDAGPALPAHRITLAAGVSWAGSYEVGTERALLTANRPASPEPYALFESRSSLAAATGAEARIGFTVSPSLAIEIGGAYSRPGVLVAISGDREAPDQALEGDPISQYVVDAGLVWQLPRVRLGRRGRPFLAGGAGYLRQLYAGHTLVETGQLYHVGAGLRYWLRGASGEGRAVGLRGDVRAMIRRAGVELDGRVRVYPAATLMLFVGI
ncbi:MAG: hypothetical protein AB7O67_09375 [Vicinamibacterales bacterium]